MMCRHWLGRVFSCALFGLRKKMERKNVSRKKIARKNMDFKTVCHERKIKESGKIYDFF